MSFNLDPEDSGIFRDVDNNSTRHERTDDPALDLNRPPRVSSVLPERPRPPNVAEDNNDDLSALGEHSSRMEDNENDWLKVKLSGTATESIGVLVPKTGRGLVGSRDYLRYMAEATTPIDPKLGVSSHMVSSRDGEVEEGDETKHHFIQELFVSNMQKIAAVKQRCIEFDMLDVLQIPEVIDPLASHPHDKYSEYHARDLLLHFDSIPFAEVKDYQFSLNSYKSPTSPDRISSNWIYSFLHKSCTNALLEQVEMHYNNIPKSQQGGITFAYVVLKVLFWSSRDTTASLKKYISLFKDKGLRRYKGENVVIAQKELDVVCARLDELGELSKEIPLDILEGYTLCSVPAFADVFKWMLQMQRAEVISADNAFSGSDSSVGTLTEVKIINMKAVDTYHALCTANDWHVSRGRTALASQPKTGPICWNCGDNHAVKDCPKPRDEAKIEAARKKWRAEKYNRNSGSGTDTNKPSSDAGERKKWGSAQLFGNVPHVHCSRTITPNGRQCGWNTTHSTKYHDAAMAQGASFDLAQISPNHPLVLAKKALSVNTGATFQRDIFDRIPEVPRERAAALLQQLERNATNDEAIEFVGTLRTIFGIK